MVTRRGGYQPKLNKMAKIRYMKISFLPMTNNMDDTINEENINRHQILFIIFFITFSEFTSPF